MKLQRLFGAICAASMFAAQPTLAAEQSSFVVPTSGPMSMATFAGTYLNPALRALASCHWGTTAPANGPAGTAIAYQCWADTTANPVLVKRYDGAQWVIDGALDTSAHTWTPYRQGAAIVAVATSGSAADLTTGTLPAARLPNPSASTLGGTQSKTCSTSNWINAISTSGVPGCAQPNFSDLIGSIACSQLPALTGDVTTSAGSCGTTLANIPSGVSAAGSIVFSNSAGSGTPASGKMAIYADSTGKRFHDKNDAGVVGTTVVGDSGAANNFLTAIDPSTGAISKARPSCASLSDSTVFCSGTSAANLTGTLNAAQMPAISGDVSSSAGSTTFTIGAGKVVNAMLGADVFSTARSWSGVQTFAAPVLTGVADLQGSPKFTGVSSVTFSSSQNDYNPGSAICVSISRLRATASNPSLVLTGLAGGVDGCRLTVENVGSNSFTLSDSSGSSTASNRFLLGGDAAIAANNSYLLEYDGTSQRWRAVVSPGAGGGGGGGVTSVACAEGAQCSTITSTGTVKTTFSRHFMLGGL